MNTYTHPLMNQSPKDAQCEKQPAIANEVGQLDKNINALKEEMDMLYQRLSPVVMHLPVENVKSPSPPDVMLPPLGETIRNQRRSISELVDRVRSLRNAIEL